MLYFLNSKFLIYVDNSVSVIQSKPHCCILQNVQILSSMDALLMTSTLLSAADTAKGPSFKGIKNVETAQAQYPNFLRSESVALEDEFY